jgi:hypothetical protein
MYNINFIIFYFYYLMQNIKTGWELRCKIHFFGHGTSRKHENI